MLAATASAVMLASTLVSGPALATPSTAQAPKPKMSPSLPVHDVLPSRERAPGDSMKHEVHGAPAVSWPKAARTRLTVSAAEKRSATTVPVTVGPPNARGARAAKQNPPSRVDVRMLGQKASQQLAGTESVAFTVAGVDGATGQVRVSMDYASFAQAAGAGYGSRLRLVRLPACALTTPDKPKCTAATVLPTDNDTDRSTLSATVTLGGSPTVLAAEAGAAGGTGDAAATPLAPSASWQVSAQTGAFSWSYPITVPSPGLGPEPDLELSYNSQTVDGRTSATNNQPSWVGDGWDLWSGFIQRNYKVCAEDQNDGANNGDKKTSDQCWGGDAVTMSLNGQATVLVKDGDSGAWRPQQDDGSRIEHLTGASNGDNDGEYWRVTTVDGTQYYFGRNRLPGWSSGDAVTNSTWTLPVFGNDPGDPCHAAAFADSSCDQAWRWNLDYAVDVNGNAISYQYNAETGYYGLNADASKKTAYNPGGSLAEIDYGYTDGHAYDTDPAAKVVFTTADRCSSGSTCDTDHPASWPDTPWDQSCLKDTCTDKYAPVFFTRKRLTTITTKIHSGSGYADVDRWTLGQSFLDTGDNDAKPLWLKSITHTGLNGGTAALPAVTFDGTQMANRVDTNTDGLSALNRYRLTGIDSETGAQTTIGYSQPQCVQGTTMPSSEDSNTLRCQPSYWYPPGEDKRLDYFHKYVVTEVRTHDSTGGSDDLDTTYDYQGDAAWHYETNGLSPKAVRTWSDWRGYSSVVVRSGSASGVRSQVKHLYLRGMDGDHKADGSTRSVSVTDSQGGTITDSPQYQGFEREQITYDKAGGSAITDVISSPWARGPTATQSLGGLTTKAWMSNTASVVTRSLLSDGGWGEKRTSSSFNDDGLVVQVDDRADTSTAADNKCTRTTYTARNTTKWILSRPAEVETDAVGCDSTATPDQVLSHVRTYYDSAALGAKVNVGNPTKAEALNSWNGTTPVYATASTTSYDSYGRPTAVTDALGHKTTTSYTPATGGPVTGTTVTDALGNATTDTLDPATGQTLSSVDANGRRTDQTYDPLGRLTAVWLPGRTKGTDDANVTYSYQINNDAASVVTSKTLTYETITNTTNYVTSYTLYDSLDRPRQTQSPAPGGGRMITDTLYDSTGQTAETSQPWYNADSPSGTLVGVNGRPETYAETAFVYDGTGRQTAAIFKQQGDEKWRTTTAYPGADRTDVTPPSGGTATTTLVDARGQATELRQYHNPTPTGAYDATKYTYTPDGDLSSVTDPAGNSWRYGYDTRGYRIKSVDPDTGTTTSTYDNLGQLTSTTDARGATIAYSYDEIGRKTGEYQDSVDGKQLASWTYDTLAGGKGLPTAATRYVDGDAYTTAVTGYDAGGRPTGTSVTIPSSQGALAGTYTDSLIYNPDGSLKATVLPAVGGLKKEAVAPLYDKLGMATGLTSGLSIYVFSATYNHDGTLAQMVNGDYDHRLSRDYSYDPATGRLIKADAVRVDSTTVTNTSYTYDPAGNITSAVDNPDGSPTTQCFDYDYLDRLTDAWTPKPSGVDGDTPGSCDTLPASTDQLGGTGAYWHSYTYDLTGNRTQLTEHIAGGDTTAVSDYPAPGAAQPHTLQSTTTTSSVGNGSTAVEQNTYAYDPAGNTTTRTRGGNTQTIDWNPDGSLAALHTGDQQTSYLYDAGGSQLIRHDPDGTATLWLPDGTELHADTAGTVTGTRYYSFDGATIGVRTPAGISWLIADQVGTDSVQVDATTRAATYRYTDPFGTARSTLPDWIGDHGFVGGIINADTGLTTLGARQYDPDTGRFISADPIADPSDPQQLNGYAYANNSPITHADPTGQLLNAVGSTAFATDEQYERFMDGYTGSTAWRRDYYPLNRAYEADPKAHDPDAGHEILSWFGYIPVAGSIADTANAVWYAAEGRWAEAGEPLGFAVIGIIPVGKVLKLVGKPLIKGGAKVAKILTKGAEEGSKAVKPAAKDTGKALAKDTAESAGKKSAKGAGKDAAKRAGKDATKRLGKNASKRATEDSDEALGAARAARDAKAAEVGAAKATVTGGYDPAKGASSAVAGCNRNPVGCAENDVERQLGIGSKDVQFSEALRPRTGKEIPICVRCQDRYDPSQFPPGVRYDPGGRWDLEGLMR
ncbi:RHS repeat-associated core domain-containing protein [Actinocatenispora comari]|uniref:Type IV secretion protein Rhs n=1 Tax=Actinocatenispora comari TaxID=2807577 RepID=A0A8J4EJZ7_9ACTN|nr:RHS repeat-associated core domain-containing protein [Actinocatenispora comari]GIL26348.1 type IV secretion protein Rhs [Actinocatenispora comari]